MLARRAHEELHRRILYTTPLPVSLMAVARDSFENITSNNRDFGVKDRKAQESDTWTILRRVLEKEGAEGP